MIERLYDEVLQEGAITDLFKDPENRPILKQLATQLTVMFGWPMSAFAMGQYVSKFLEKNFPHLPEQIIHGIKKLPDDQLLDLLK